MIHNNMYRLVCEAKRIFPQILPLLDMLVKKCFMSERYLLYF